MVGVDELIVGVDEVSITVRVDVLTDQVSTTDVTLLLVLLLVLGPAEPGIHWLFGNTTSASFITPMRRRTCTMGSKLSNNTRKYMSSFRSLKSE